MQPLESADIHCLRAAEGWIELGNLKEAHAELLNVSPAGREHPAALETAFHVFAKQQNWDAARDAAKALTEKMPDHGGGWLHLAYATRRATGGSIQAAFEILQSVSEKFPKEPTILYNLACYCCQMGRQKEAWNFLERAFDIGDRKTLKLMALQDPDLEPMRQDIAKI